MWLRPRRSADRRPLVARPLALTAALVAASVGCAGCDRGGAKPPSQPAAAVSSPAAPSPLVQQGAGAYPKTRPPCHGEFASGYVADNAPSLRSPTFLTTASADFLRA